MPMTQITVLDGKEIKVIPTDETAPLAQKVATNAAIYQGRSVIRKARLILSDCIFVFNFGCGSRISSNTNITKNSVN